MRRCNALHVLAHHGNHEVEKTDGLNEGEAQNGVGEELATEGWVAGDTEEEGTEDQANANSRSAETDGSVTHTEVLGDLDHGVGHLGAVWAGLEAGLGSLADHGGLLTLHGLEWGLCGLLDA